MSPFSRPSRQRGFTLFELLLVLVILSLTAAIIAPKTSALSSRRMDACVRQVFAMARHARAQAVTRGLKTRIQINRFDRRVWFEIEQEPFDSPGEFTAPGDAWGEGVTLPEGVEFASVDAETVTFGPDGTAEDARIGFRDKTGEERAVEIRGVTGLSRVLDVEELNWQADRGE